MRTLLVLGLGIALAAACANTADADGLYAVQGSSIVTINPFTGAVTFEFAAPGVPGQVAGLSGAEGGNVLIYSDSGNGTGTPLFRIDPTTGATLSTHALPIDNRGGLSFQSGTTDSIFSINDGAPVVRQLGYGAAPAAFVGVGPNFPGAMGGDDNGRHFVWAGGAILEFDGATGNVLNNLGNRPGANYSGIAFDGQNLYLADSVDARVFTVDPNTGALLHVATLSNGQVADGLGWIGEGAVVPEPGTFALVGLAGTLLLLRRRRRRTAA